MQHQYFNSAFQQQTFNPQNEPLDHQQRCYQISPFGVTLQPISVRPHSNPVPVSFIQPSSPSLSPSKTNAGHLPTSLTPLSCGGFIYHPSSLSQTPPQPPPMLSPPQTPSSHHFTTNAPQFVSREIAARQEKLEKYREKRARRNYNRPVDQGKRERACARTRDANGHFASEQSKREQVKMKQALEASQRESKLLKSKLSDIEQELQELRQRAEEEIAYKEHIQKQLEAQQQMNQALICENTLLWSTVPSDEVFNTINQTNPPVFLDAFKQKVDFSTIELNWTDSPHLEAARLEDTEFEQRWDVMSEDCFFAGALS
jgi:hypothetical protein